MSDALKAQFPRHCFIQIPERETQPMLVPFVKQFGVFPEDVREYERVLYEQAKALPVPEVDALLRVDREQIKARAMEYLTAPQVDHEAAEAVDANLDDGVE